jgi:SAM-dependent methyltransferase
MTSCPLCNSRNTQGFLQFKGARFYRCADCSLVFLEAGFHPDAGSVYTADYIKDRGHDAFPSSLVKAKMATADRYLSLAEKYVEKGDLLEVGCSTGPALKVARERGWNVHGIEVNDKAARIAKDMLRVTTIETGCLGAGMFPGKAFSLVLMLDVLEHIADPLAFMGILAKKIRPGGFILILTPNIRSLSARVMRGRWPHLMLEHVSLYSPRSLTFLLKAFRFKVVRMGWAVKYVNTAMLRHHLQCHPHVFMAGSALGLMKACAGLDRMVFPFNIGETYVLAQKQ